MFNQNDPYNQSPLQQSNPYNQPSPFTAYPQYNRYNQRSFSGCGLLIGVVFILASIGVFLYLLTQGQSLFSEFQGQPFTITSIKLGAITVGASLLGLIGFLALIGRGGRKLLGKFISILFTIAIIGLVAYTAFWAFFINPNVGMTATSFTRGSVSISTGDSLHFANPANGVVQVLCIGVDQHCQTAPGAPGAFSGGLHIQPGQTVTVTFPTEGNYSITSETTPHMNITITVNVPDNSGG